MLLAFFGIHLYFGDGFSGFSWLWLSSKKTILEALIPPQVLLTINHSFSHEDKLLQAIDLFAWGIFRKYEIGGYAMQK
jgi:hypothetical protein